MGNWRSVEISGSCPADQVQGLRVAATAPDWLEENTGNRIEHCLLESRSLCGLGAWTSEKIEANGNLYERDFSIANVADALRFLSAAAPELEMVVHCGGDWESRECVATVRLKDGVVHVGDPEILHVAKISEEAIQTNLLSQLREQE